MINFIKDNRFSDFLNKVALVSKIQTDSSYIDLSPNDLFDGEIGTILVKNGSDILYKGNSDVTFVNLSYLFPYLIEPKKYLLEQGINKKVTWVKNSSSINKTWKFLGYQCPFSTTCNQCAVLEYYSA
jgi:hypothetical protein